MHLRRGIRAGEPTLRSADNIGLDNAGHKTLWDAEHPDDLRDIPGA